MGKQTTWTFQPDDDVIDLVKKAIVEKVGKKNSKDPRKIRGLRTLFTNTALRKSLACLAGKRDLR